MFKNILVPLDLTDKHQPALQTAAELAGQDGAVTLLHVVEVIQGLPLAEEKGFYDRLEQKACRHLERQGAFFQEQHVPWRGDVRLGVRAREVVRYAAEVGSDLIVLTAPRLADNPESGWGSLSWKVSLLAQCPVLLIK